jgi:glutathione reductase (NADPH)
VYWRFVLKSISGCLGSPWGAKVGISGGLADCLGQPLELQERAAGCRLTHAIPASSLTRCRDAPAIGPAEAKPMSVEKFDVVILGSGNAGMAVTVPTREAGMSVAMIEDRDLGGTCPNRGCTPKKVLVAAAHALHEIERAKEHCISVGRPSLDWAGLIDREKDMIKAIPDRLGRLMSDRGVAIIRGRAVFAGPNTIKLADRTLEARHIVIATGSTPRTLPIAGAQDMITSDEVLSERNLPHSVVFIGGGVIALEFSHVYARAGAKVTILEALPRLLGAMDLDAVEHIRKESERIGIEMRTGVAVRRIERADSALRVVYEDGGVEKAVIAERVVNGAGRVANVDGLDLGAGGVERDGGRIAVDAYLRSKSNPAVYVCGDALWSSPQLSPIATYEGRIVGRNIVEGPRHQADYAAIPSCVYTVPALASVGMTEASAIENGHKVTIHANDMASWLSGRTFAETVAWAKVLVDATTDRLLGAHLVGHAGEELIHIFALAMRHGIPASALKEATYGFPTFSSDIKNML